VCTGGGRSLVPWLPSHAAKTAASTATVTTGMRGGAFGIGGFLYFRSTRALAISLIPREPGTAKEHGACRVENDLAARVFRGSNPALRATITQRDYDLQTERHCAQSGMWAKLPAPRGDQCDERFLERSRFHPFRLLSAPPQEAQQQEPIARRFLTSKQRNTGLRVFLIHARALNTERRPVLTCLCSGEGSTRAAGRRAGRPPRP
jgi:hypothetical protein